MPRRAARSPAALSRPSSLAEWRCWCVVAVVAVVATPISVVLRFCSESCARAAQAQTEVAAAIAMLSLFGRSSNSPRWLLTSWSV